MRAIITGVGGLLGSGLAAHLKSCGYEVIGISRTQIKDPNVDTFFKCDLSDSNVSRGDWTFLAPATVFHLAGNTQVYEKSSNFWGDNVTATVTACEIAKQTGNKMIFVSSSAVYSGEKTRMGKDAGLLTEDDPTSPQQKYGLSKRVAEDVIRLMDVNAIIFRLFAVLSSGLVGIKNRGNLIQSIELAVRTGSVVRVLNSMRQGSESSSPVRDYVMDSDVYKFLAKGEQLLSMGDIRGVKVFNLCSGLGTDVYSMIEAAERYSGKKIRVEDFYGERSDSEVMVGSPARLREVFGAVPEKQVDEFWRELFK